MVDATKKGGTMVIYTNYDQLPLALGADDVAQVLGISRANAYNLMRSKGFPTLKIGKRMTVPKQKLIEWINAQMSA
jgi:excisionase family DNA binding protein